MGLAGLYIHVPFCAEKCNYCDFLSFGLRGREGDGRTVSGSCVGPYFDALCEEIGRAARGESELSKLGVSVPEQFDSVYIGGGTPTVAGADNLCRLLATVRHSFNLTADCEITVEANPGTVDLRALRDLRSAGVNRLSLGIQALRPGLLKALGRIHSDFTAKSCAEVAKLFFDSLNLDFILGIPGIGDVPPENLEDVEDIVRFVEKLRPEHISAYSLITEPGTRFWDWREQGILNYPDEALERELYHTLRTKLEALGYIQYEISNFALPGKFSRHNLKYWEGVPYLGLGAGAVSCLKGPDDMYIRFKAGDKLDSFTAYSVQETLDLRARKQEFMLLGFRKLKGPDNSQYKALFGSDADMEQDFARELTGLRARGLINGDNSLTVSGLDFANEIFMEFV